MSSEGTGPPSSRTPRTGGPRLRELLRSPTRATEPAAFGAAEQWGHQLAAPLVAALESLHGRWVDTEVLVRPCLDLLLHQWANFAGEGIVTGGQAAAPQAFATLKEWAATAPGDPAHALLLTLLGSPDPWRAARDLLDRGPVEFHSLPASPAPSETRGRPRVGVSFGLHGTDRIRLRIRLAGRIRWIRAREPTIRCWQREARDPLLGALEGAAHGLSMPPDSPALLAYLALVLPSYLVEALPREAARARARAKGLSGLVGGTEFQRKPAVAVLWAVLCDEGKPVQIVQHGGGYGTADPNWWERAERRVAARFWSWGEGSLPADQPLPSPKLSREASRARRKKKAPGTPPANSRQALLLLPFLSHEGEAALASPPYDRQRQAAAHSVHLLTPLLSFGWSLTVRLHPKNHTDDPLVPPLPEGAHLERGQRDVLAVDAARYEAVFFSSPHATGLAECRAGGHPFRIVADPHTFAVRPEAAALFEEARHLGIWWSQPVQAEKWCRQGCPPPTPQALDWFQAFEQRFALHSPHFLDDWTRFLRSFPDLP